MGRDSCVECGGRPEYRLSMRPLRSRGHGPAVFFHWCARHGGAVLDTIGIVWTEGGYPMRRQDLPELTTRRSKLGA